MLRIYIPALLILAMVLSACGHEPAVTALDRMSAEQLVDAARHAAERAQQTSGHRSKSMQKDWAIKGRAYAERCVKIAPERPDCYYWRAVNIGLYHQVKVRGYQSGIKRMIADCDKVIALGQGSYDHAGPYRIPGEIYTKLPETGGRPDSVVRDLDKAEKLLHKAVSLAPDYPENRIALAEVLYRKDLFAQALDQLNTAKQDARSWRSDSAYREWQKTIKTLTRKIARKQ